MIPTEAERIENEMAADAAIDRAWFEDHEFDDPDLDRPDYDYDEQEDQQ